VQQIPYQCKLHPITDSFGIEAWAKRDLIFWYVSLRVRFNLNALFTRTVLSYFRDFILLLLSSLNKNTKLLKKDGQQKKKYLAWKIADQLCFSFNKIRRLYWRSIALGARGCDLKLLR